MTRRRQLVEALLTEQGFLPRMRTQEAQAGNLEAHTPEPGPRTEFPDAVSGARAGHTIQERPPSLVAGGNSLNEGPPVNDPAADWMDAMSAWNSADIAQHINKQTRKDAGCDIAAK